jgi:hypothetical protein
LANPSLFDPIPLRPSADLDQQGSPSLGSHLRALGLFSCLALVFYWRILWTNEFSFLTESEAVRQAYSWWHFISASLKAGHWPLWDPFTSSGHSFIGEMQTGAFYPLNLLMALIPFNKNGLFSPKFYHVLIVISHILCAYLMWVFLRYLKADSLGAIVGSLCFSFGGVLARMEGWPHLLNSGIWLPLILLLVLRSLEQTRPLARITYAAWAGIVLGIAALAGGLHAVIMEAIVVTVVVFFQSMTKPFGDRSRNLRDAAVSLVVLMLFAVGTAAIQLLPSAEYGQIALRWVGNDSLSATRKIPYSHLGEGLQPHAFLALLFGYPSSDPAQGEYVNPYMSVLGFAFALIGIWRFWTTPLVRCLTVLSLAAYLYSLGASSLLHGVLYVAVPGLWIAREANRFMYIADFCLAILAAYGATALFRLPAESRLFLQRILKWALVATGVLLVVPVLFQAVAMHPWVLFSLMVMLMSSGLLFYLLKGGSKRWRAAAIVTLILIDLYAFDWSARNRREEGAKNADAMETLLSTQGAVSFLRSQDGLFRISIPQQAPPNIGAVFGIQTTSGAGVTMTKDYSQIFRQDDLLNVRYVMLPATAGEPNPVYEDQSWKLYENRDYLPRAWLVHSTEHYSSPKELALRLESPEFHPRETGLLESGRQPQIDPRTSGQETILVRRYQHDQIELTVKAASRALLVVSETYYPGWQAKVNNIPFEIWKVDGGLRGIVVPPGDNLVTLTYAPSSFRLGAILTALAVLAGIAVAAVTFSTRRTLTNEHL